MAPNSLGAIVRDYIVHHRERAWKERRWFELQRSLEDAIGCAARAVSPKGKRLAHQRRISADVLHEWADRLLQRAVALRAATTFHELHAIIAAARMNGIGPLTVYDTANRIGAFLKLEPERVYLHAGTRTGAQALGLKNRDWLMPSELPEILRQLQPAELEDCLCIYKDALRRTLQHA